VIRDSINHLASWTITVKYDKTRRSEKGQENKVWKKTEKSEEARDKIKKIIK
jgi:hypothetical protein